MFLFNTGGVFLFSVVVLIVIVFLYRKWKKYSSRPKQKTKGIICIGIYISIVIVTGSIMLGDLQRPSTVNVYPLLALENINLSDADGIIVKLESVQKEIGNQFEIIDSEESYKGFLFFPENEIDSKVNVSIKIHDDCNLAEDTFELYRSRHSAKTKYIYLRLSESSEALLFNSRVNRADGLGWNAIIDRNIKTCARVNNMTIEISETKRDGKDIGQASNIAIENLCKLLLN